MRNEVQKLPEEFLDRLKKIVPAGKFDQIANTFAEAKPTTFRINRLKVKEAGPIREKLEREGFRLESISWYPDAFILKEGRLRELQESDIYKNGEIYVQNLSSMIPPLILNPKAGEMVLDLTAAPGSKTTQMAAMMNGEEKIFAYENDKVRFFKLKSNLEMQGAKNVHAILGYGESVGRKFPNYFNKVLLDAPCSSEGRFNTKESSSFGYWKLRKIEEMARKQKKLFYSAFHTLKPGGTMVYSTCTFAPEENEGILDWAIQKFQDAIEIMEITNPVRSIANRMHGISVWGKEKFNQSVSKGVRILPSVQMEAFFVTQVRKTKELEIKTGSQ